MNANPTIQTGEPFGPTRATVAVAAVTAIGLAIDLWASLDFSGFNHSHSLLQVSRSVYVKESPEIRV